jgi:chitin disaccharide deacetylase
MTHNPALRDLGFSVDDRVVVVHADDVGMCDATVDAFFDLAETGLTSSASVMVPCPSFPQVATRGRGRPDLDVGVHLTLTSEWDCCRWGPISTRDTASGLIDDEGYLFRNQNRWSRVDPEAVRAEVEAQVDRALASGLDLTHIDTHMFSMLSPELIGDYVELGFARRLPVLMARQEPWVSLLPESAIAAWEQDGLPVFDDLRQMPLDQPTTDWLELAKRNFDDLSPGLTYFITHPATDTSELRSIAADWRQRVADYAVWGNDDLRDHVRACGVHVIGWRPLQELFRKRCGRP